MKQAIIMNSDVKMSKGKTAAQAAHGSLTAYVNANGSLSAKDWYKNSMTKVVLKADLNTMLAIAKGASANGIPVAIIKDEGRTEIEPGTITCVAIGPSYEDLISRFTKDLKLL